jgi:hypothetical protein
MKGVIIATDYLKDNNGDFKILELNPYNVSEKIFDITQNKKISFDDFLKKYLIKKSVKLISRLNNKVVVQDDNLLNLFSFKNENESFRFLEGLNNYMIDNGRMDCIIVSETSKAQKKYLGNINMDYPKKNWSSLILWNCAHPKHKILTPDFISNQTGKFLHRFSWLEDEDIGDIPKDWNWLAIEYPENKNAKLIHYTLGTPCFKEYWDCDMSDIWHANQKRVVCGMKV